MFQSVFSFILKNIRLLLNLELCAEKGKITGQWAITGHAWVKL